MKVSEKLDMFSKLAIKQAEEKRIRILNEIKEEYNRALREIQDSLQKEADSTIREEAYKVWQEKNRVMLQSSVEMKRSLIELRDELADKLFDNIREKLNEYMQTPEYESALMDQIQKISRQYCDLLIYLDPVDMRFAEQIKWRFNADVDCESLIGGFRVLIKEKHMVIENSFSARLEEAKENFNAFKIVE